jgi:hypothetical protein
MRIGATGFGAGNNEIDGLPNCTQVVLGEALVDSTGTATGQPLVLLEANIDDATGETLAHAVATLMESGALDAWLTPVVMKKGRPGNVLSVLADPTLADELSAVMRVETGTLGVRAVHTNRWAASRSHDEVDVAGLAVRVKVSPGRVKAEYRDAARVASLTGLPLREVVSIAETAWRNRSEEAVPPLHHPDHGHDHDHDHDTDHDPGPALA